MEKDLVVQALKRSGGNQQKAAQSLGFSRDALRRRMEKFGLKEAIGAFLMLLAFLARRAPPRAGSARRPPGRLPLGERREGEDDDGEGGLARAGAVGRVLEVPRRYEGPGQLTLELKPLCLSCHTARAEDMKKANVHSAFKDMDCNTCHQPHVSRTRRFSTRRSTSCARPATIEGCGDRQGALRRQRLRGQVHRLPQPHASKNPKLILEAKEHIPFGSRSCEMCHAKTAADGKPALRRYRRRPASSATPTSSSEEPRRPCPVLIRRLHHLPPNPHVSKRVALVRKPLADICWGATTRTPSKDAHPCPVTRPRKREKPTRDAKASLSTARPATNRTPAEPEADARRNFHPLWGVSQEMKTITLSLALILAAAVEPQPRPRFRKGTRYLDLDRFGRPARARLASAAR